MLPLFHLPLLLSTFNIANLAPEGFSQLPAEHTPPAWLHREPKPLHDADGLMPPCISGILQAPSPPVEPQQRLAGEPTTHLIDHDKIHLQSTVDMQATAIPPTHSTVSNDRPKPHPFTRPHSGSTIDAASTRGQPPSIPTPNEASPHRAICLARFRPPPGASPR